MDLYIDFFLLLMVLFYKWIEEGGLMVSYGSSLLVLVLLYFNILYRERIIFRRKGREYR
jgi:uncharacterized membrane protein YobD (UPF0266 family)